MSGMDEAKLKEEMIRMRDEMLSVAEPILALKPGDWVTTHMLVRTIRTVQEIVHLLDLLVKYLVEGSER